MSKLLVIDLSNFIYRAHYAITPLNAPDGTPVNAVYGVLGMFHNMLIKYKPTHVIVARESAGVDSVRKALYADYKSTRSDAPDSLKPQFSLISEMLRGLEMVQESIVGYEADDVIGSVVMQWKDKFDEVLIASGDKDLLQFVDDKVKVIDTLKSITYDKEEVKKKMGVYPDQVVDYLALIGDKSDNIPGVEGVGPKGASQLLERYGSLEKIIAELGVSYEGRYRECLQKGKDSAELSKNLATIRTGLDLSITPDDCKYTVHSTPQLEEFFERLGFKSWKGRL